MNDSHRNTAENEVEESIRFIRASEQRRQASYEEADRRIRLMREIQDFRDSLCGEELFG